MENNYEIIPLFPVPLYKTIVPNKLSKVTHFLNNQELFSLETSLGQAYGERSKNTYILNEPECLDLSKYILNHVLIYSKNYLGLRYDSLKFSQSWISIKKPSQHHTPHSHSNSIISGVLYFGDYDKNTSSIVFHNPKSSTNTFILSPLQNNQNTRFSLSPTPGELIIFPSYLQHSVPENTTDKVRKSLAFNIVPTEGFGHEDSLNKLNTN